MLLSGLCRVVLPELPLPPPLRPEAALEEEGCPVAGTLVAADASPGTLLDCWSSRLLLLPLPAEEDAAALGVPEELRDAVLCLEELPAGAARTSEWAGPTEDDDRLPGRSGAPGLATDGTASDAVGRLPPTWCSDSGEGTGEAATASVLELAEDDEDAGCADLLAFTAASLVARCSVSSSSKFLRRPATARRSDRECVLQVSDRVHGLPLSPIRTPQCLFGSYSRSLQGSSFLSRCAFFPWEDPAETAVAAEALPATFLTGAAVAVLWGCAVTAGTGMAAVTGPTLAPVASADVTWLVGCPGPGPDNSPRPRGVRGGGCCGEGSSFSRP